MKLQWSAYEEVLLALVLWREARGEGEEGMTAVGCCIRNRAAHSGWWGNGYVEVIMKPYQFSSMTSPSDPQLTRFPASMADMSFHEALHVSGGIIGNWIEDVVDGANHYHDISIASPKWADPAKFVKQIGRLKFYKL